MAIIKVISKSSKTKAGLKAVLKYVGEKANETEGLNCDNDFQKVYNNFLETKNFFNKNEGRQYRHYIQSFSPNEIELDKVLELSKKWAEKVFEGHEVFMAVHNDREHLHTHFIVNSVNFSTGKKLHESKKELKEKKKINDEICYEYGIDNSIHFKKEGTVIAYDKNKYQILKKGGDIGKLAITILNGMEKCISKKDFINYMSKQNYEVEWKDEKKHIIFKINDEILEGKKNKFRLENLKKTFNLSYFTKEKLIDKFNENLLKELLNNNKNTVILENEKNIKDNFLEKKKINQLKKRNLDMERD